MVYNRKYIDKYILYRKIRKEDNVAIFCDKYLQKFLIEVGDKMKISKDNLKNIVLYYNTVNCPLFNGRLNNKSELSNSGNLRSFPSIGLPMSFKYIYFDETSFDNLVIDGKEIEMASDSPEGVEFRRQLLLTEDAKKFVLARQLCYLQSNVFEVVDTIKILSFYGLFQALYFMRNTAFGASGSTILRAIVYTGLSVAVYFLQRELGEAYNARESYKADQVAADIGPRYFSGAIEFYSKMIKSNKLLYEMGFTGKVNKMGNEHSGIFTNYGWINSHSRIHQLISFDGGKQQE